MPDDNVSVKVDGRAPTPREMDTLARSGRLTPEEADGLRKAGGSGERDETITAMRLRHTGDRLDALVAVGRIDRQEANALLDRIHRGEHSPALRAQVRMLERSGQTSGSPGGDAHEAGRS